MAPAPRTSLALGRVLRDVVVILVQGTVLTAVAVPFGLRAAFASISYAVALTLESEDG